MNWFHILVFTIIFVTDITSGAVVPENDDINEQGLYSKADHVQVLTIKNFDKKVYGQKHATLIQFYNSYCGHCRAFAPKFKNLAKEILAWKNIIRLAVLDCSVEENNAICRQFEVMIYPSLRYLHENYVKAITNVGDSTTLQSTDSVDTLKDYLVTKMQSEKSKGRLVHAPSFEISSYSTYDSALRSVSKNAVYVFFVFEGKNSTIGSQLALDINDYRSVEVKRIYDNSELAEIAGVKKFPGLTAVVSNLEHAVLTPVKPTKHNMLKEINSFLRSKNYNFPIRDKDSQSIRRNDLYYDDLNADEDAVYYQDLEKTLRTSLHTEITRRKVFSKDVLRALLDYLHAIIEVFPFRGRLRPFVVDLHNTLSSKSEWGGDEVYDLVNRLEAAHAPVYEIGLDYKACRGSQPQFRGYTCGLWTMFHTLTLNAARSHNNLGPNILKAMLGYIKYFFGCTECSKHFQEMADKNKLSEVNENDKAVLWLWIAHNEVNLRLSGDLTEDPRHPKIQFPSPARCPECRKSKGAWDLPKVYQYLQSVYGVENIRDATLSSRDVTSVPSPFSDMDMGLLSLLYILSFIILILVVKFFLSNRFSRKRRYKHEYGKV